MQIWLSWWDVVKTFRPAFSRNQTFLWFVAIMMGLCVRNELIGVTSIIRALGFQENCYLSLLHFYHSSAVNLDKLTCIWVKHLTLKSNLIYKVNGRMILLADGIKVAKEGRKMPGVKSLHQESESNSKPEFIMGHSCQAISILLYSAEYFFATPLIARIHEGIVTSNRSSKTLLDKMADMALSLPITQAYFFVVDAYYASHKTVNWLLKNGQHLVTRVRSNAVAYMPATPPNKGRRGRRAIYGPKVIFSELFKDTKCFTIVTADLYDDKNVSFRYLSMDLLWKPVGILVRFVLVDHPRGKAIFMSTDLALLPLKIIEIYSLRYKIEVSFKQALHSLGAYLYHFWMKTMNKIGRKSGDQYLHKKPKEYRESVAQKMLAYHIHIQLGLIAQGILQILAMTLTKPIWNAFGSWLRTIRPNVLPSEKVVMVALKNSLPQFLNGKKIEAIIAKFILSKIDLTRAEGVRMII